MSMILTGMLDLDSHDVSEIHGGNTSTFTQVNFPTPFPAGSQVVVIPMVQTFNGPDTPGVRIADVTATGFRIRLNELVAEGKSVAAGGGHHTKERVAWLATTV
ncbi:hypothetical protein [Nocardia sp. NPDC052566]|uniref:hypothetical protein n=1 Tax=Nocardia sp. NPDC052566 TaxID=3364330 RepID=UPI0037CB1340